MPIEEVVATLAQETRNRYYGKYRGIVVDTDDPDQMGRLTAKVPGLLGDEVVTGWATPCVPYGGSDNLGFFMVPEKDAGVWIEFEGGDLEFPIWSGTYWRQSGGKSEAPKLNDAAGEEKEPEKSAPTCKIIKTKKGHTIQLEDKDDEEMIVIKEAKNNHVITMDKEGITITDGKNTHKITMKKDTFEINATKVFSIKQGDNTLTMDDNGIIIKDKNSNQVEMASAGITIKDKNSNQVEMASAGITIKNVSNNKLELAASGIKLVGVPMVIIQDAAGVVGKIQVTSGGVILGLGAGGPIATVGTCMVPTLLGPQAILPGPNVTSMA